MYLENAGARAKNVCLTDRGKALAEKTALRIIEMENDIFESWAEEDMEAYLHCLKGLILKKSHDKPLPSPQTNNYIFLIF